ncbi:MAG: SDR family oxidoreductase [Pseudomonadota bacterium]
MKIAELFSVAGKVALVTGGSRGIGHMIARGLIENGVKVYITARKAQACEAAAAALSRYGACVPLPADLSHMAEITRLAEAIAAREEKLHILINNAGATWGASFDDFPEEGWDKVVNVNMKPIMFLTQKLSPLLAAAASKDDPARVINIASIDGLRVSSLETYSYAASKAGVIHLTRMMAKFLAPRHFTVNAVAPGPFESKMMAATLAAAGDAIRAAVPLKRIGAPADMAGVVLYLASQAGAYVTGAVIPVDGGLATTV